VPVTRGARLNNSCTVIGQVVEILWPDWPVADKGCTGDASSY